MLKCPLIVGNRGNMGQRYSAILRHLGINFVGVDKGDAMVPAADIDSVILATPTLNHVAEVRRYLRFGVPILVEKPIAKDLSEVLELCRDVEDAKGKLAMVNQYEYILRYPGNSGDTRYDYFRHGGDGMAWDCINILGLARGKVELAEKSPIWTCTINGEHLSLGDMDAAYVKMIKSWLTGDQDNVAYIRKAHRKVQEYLDCQKQS